MIIRSAIAIKETGRYESKQVLLFPGLFNKRTAIRVIEAGTLPVSVIAFVTLARRTLKKEANSSARKQAAGIPSIPGRYLCYPDTL